MGRDETSFCPDLYHVRPTNEVRVLFNATVEEPNVDNIEPEDPTDLTVEEQWERAEKISDAKEFLVKTRIAELEEEIGALKRKIEADAPLIKLGKLALELIAWDTMASGIKSRLKAAVKEINQDRVQVQGDLLRKKMG